MKKYDQKLINKIALRLTITPKSVKEQISKRAMRHNVAPEAELANWARKLGISASQYIKNKPDSVKSQIYSTSSARVATISTNPQRFKIVQIGKSEDHWYNLWWVQWLGAGLVVGTGAQVLGAIITNYFHITNP